MIRGIGPVYAKRLLRAFGERVFDVIEAEPDRLREVDGIGYSTSAYYRRGRDTATSRRIPPHIVELSGFQLQ
jgi:hypothetical protein